MADSKEEITYEVHVLQKGRWEIHATYPSDKRGPAIQDAKGLEKISTIEGVKVVRDVVTADSDTSASENIYASSNLANEQPKAATEAKAEKAKTPAQPQKKTAKASKPRNKTAAKPKGKKKAPPKKEAKGGSSVFSVIIKLLMMALVSVILAFFVSGIASVWIKDTSLSGNLKANISLALFIGTAIISLLAMGIPILSKTNFAPRPRKAKAEPAKATQTPSTEPAPDLDLLDLDEKPEPESFGAEPGAALKEDEADDFEPDTPKIREQKAFVMDFLVESLKSGKVNKDKLDNFNKFGVNLFIAGAAETVAKKKRLNGKMEAKIISEPLKFLGFKNDEAEAFADKIPGYLVADSKYMQMYQAGRSAMNAHFDEEADACNKLAPALEEWNKPKETEDVEKTVTVLFTDIAGSTKMTQTLGDAGAQKVVRAHNRIVREALTKFNGTEIKHTGDGIMASFTSTSQGVESAADMQLQTALHNKTNPEMPLGLKIGLNAGEPIAEDNDLFGTTVQLAARIVDKAQAGQVFVSDTVQGICSGKKFRFKNQGGFDFKGFDGDMNVYELLWSNEPDTETATEEKQNEEESQQVAEDVAPDEPQPETPPESEAKPGPGTEQESVEKDQAVAPSPPQPSQPEKNETTEPTEAQTPEPEQKAAPEAEPPVEPPAEKNGQTGTSST